MVAPVCPVCGSDKLFVCRGTGSVPIFVECGAWNCGWTQEPDMDLACAAAVETYRRRNQPKEAA